MASSGRTDVPVSPFGETSVDDADAAAARVTLGLDDLMPMISNLKITKGTANDVLELFAASSGGLPDASNVIRMAISNGTGFVYRTRAAAHLSRPVEVHLRIPS